MASDLAIELFARDMFACFWYKTRVKNSNAFDVCEDEELDQAESYLEVRDELFHKVIFLRHLTFEKLYSKDFTDEKIKSLKSLLDCYEYVIHSCDREDLFGNLTIFEKMFATLTFVMVICHCIHKHTANVDVINHGHIFWAMYFDKFTDEFYEKGGWNKLNREIKRYKFLCDINHIFDGYPFLYLQTLKEASVNYCIFKNSADYHERKEKHQTRISYAWIKFRIDYLENYINIPLCYELGIEPNEVELLMEDLKKLLDPTTCNPSILDASKEKHQISPFSTEMSYSEIPCVSEEMKSNQDDKQFQQLSFEHKRIIDKVSDGFPDICTDFKKESESTYPTSTVEELSLDIIDANENLELKQNAFKEMKQLRQEIVDTKSSHIGHRLLLDVDMKRQPKTSIKKLQNISNIDLDLDHGSRTESHINKKDNSNEYSHEGNVEIAKLDQVSMYQMEKNKYRRNSSTKNPANSMDFENESVSNGNETENSEEMIKISLCSKTGGIEIAKSTDDSSSSQMAAPEGNGKTTPKNLPTMKDFVSVNENTATEDESRKIRKVREELRKEQSDQEINKFLTMLLVLGDIEGTEFVLSTLRNSKEDSGNARANSNKKLLVLGDIEGTEFVLSTLQNSKEDSGNARANSNKKKKKKKKKN